MILFGSLTYLVGMRYQMLYEDPPEALSGSLFLAAVAAAVGWYVVGPRIDRSYIRGVTVVLQGYIATLLGALFLYGFYDAFTKGYAMKYRDFGDAINGVMVVSAEHLMRMLDQDFLIFLAMLTLAIAVVITTIYRTAEARRLAR
ncbi:MAG: hypothetical protein EA339_10610 [Rhodobacteraceae bacterium]|nr:MAG: hypothetical protein EA339_10610 [Paracoccaceae bacterium]